MKRLNFVFMIIPLMFTASGCISSSGGRATRDASSSTPGTASSQTSSVDPDEFGSEESANSIGERIEAAINNTKEVEFEGDGSCTEENSFESPSGVYGCPCEGQQDAYPGDDWDCNPTTGYGVTCWEPECGLFEMCVQAIPIDSLCPLNYGWTCGYDASTPGCFKVKKASAFAYYENTSATLDFNPLDGTFTECWSISECGGPAWGDGGINNGVLEDDVFACHNLPTFLSRDFMMSGGLGAITWNQDGSKFYRYKSQVSCETSPLGAAWDCSPEFQCTGGGAPSGNNDDWEEFCEEYCDVLDDCGSPLFQSKSQCDDQCMMAGLQDSSACKDALKAVLSCLSDGCNTQNCMGEFTSLTNACGGV
jgi:hypothetical protein